MTARPELHNLFAATGEDGARPGRQGDHHGRSQHQVDELRLQLPGWKYWRRKRNSQRQQVKSSLPDFLDFKVSSQDPDTAWPGLRLQCPLPWRDRNVYEQRGALHDSPLRQWCGHGQRDPGQPHVCHLLQRLCTEASQAAGHRGRLFRAGEVPGRGSWAEGGILYTRDSGQYCNSHTEYNNCNVLALTSLLDTITVLYSAVLCTHCTTIITVLTGCSQQSPSGDTDTQNFSVVSVCPVRREVVFSISNQNKSFFLPLRFSDLYSAALRDAGMLCLAIYRAVDPEEVDAEEGEEGGEEFECNSEKVSGFSFFLLSVISQWSGSQIFSLALIFMFGCLTISW